MTAARLLRWVVALLPPRRREWGRAMEAELAALESGRWRFALSCARGVLVRPGSIVPVLVAGLAVALLSEIRSGAVRLEAIAMLAIVGAFAWPARRNPLTAVVAAEALIFLAGLRGADAATAQIVVWTAMLSIYAVALSGMPATGAGLGVAAAAAWLLAAVLDPSVPTSSGPAMLAIAAAAVVARDRIARFRSAATAALLIAVMIDGPLRLFSPWVANSAPPVYPPESVERLIDSIGIWLVGCLLALALSLAGHANVTWTRRRGVTLTP
jgi:hypothetical protein